MASRYLLVAKVESQSEPGKSRQVKTDGDRLTCSCGGWVFNHRGDRTCRHTDYVNELIRPMGGLPAILGLLRRGIALDTDAPSQLATDHTSGPRRRRPSRPTHRPAPAPVVAPPTTREVAVSVAQQPQPAWLGGGRPLIIRD